MSRSQQWISAWISMVLTLILLVTGVSHVEAEPAMANVVSKPIGSFSLMSYLLYQKGVPLATIRRENQQITEGKQEVRRLVAQQAAEQKMMLASRAVEMAEFARFQRFRLGERVAASAQNFIGAHYAWGGTNPQQGFDCSGFTQYVLSTNGIKVPRNSYDQFAIGQSVSKTELQPGDLVFFTTYAPGPSHLGIYVGNGQFVHALNHTTGVITSKLDTDYYKEHFIGAKRVL
ncbi:MAG: C40 family peptidase [Tumebacillaceae bacterium]